MSEKKNNLNKWIEKLSPKNLKKDQLLIILLAGILLVVIAIPTSGSKSEKKKSSAETQNQKNEMQEEELAEYEEKMEAKLKKALAKVAGVGEVEVVITLRSTSEKVIEKDTQDSGNTVGEEDSDGGTRNTKDYSYTESTIYEENENGGQSPYIKKELEPEVEGVVVIAEGGDNSTVAGNISEAVMALFQVEAHKIKVMKMN